MRIRKRSGALFASSSSWERARDSTSSSSGRNGNGEEEFVLPLVAATMDVQQVEEEDGDHGTGANAIGTHPRPAHNWRNALQLQRCGVGNTRSQAVEDGGEGEKVKHEWNGCMRNQRDNIKLFTKEGTQAAALLMKEDTRSSSAEKELTGGRDEEWKLPKSGVHDLGASWKRQDYLCVHSVKRKRSKSEIGNIKGKSEIGNIKGWKDDETMTSKNLRQETYIQQEDGRKLKDKAMHNSNKEAAEGAQCRRRNGRGWRCSQRTLVGYSLCEHHLSKGRLSKNNKASRVTVNNKVGTCKFKELSLIDASLSCNVQDNLDQERAISRMHYKSYVELAEWYGAE